MVDGCYLISDSFIYINSILSHTVCRVWLVVILDTFCTFSSKSSTDKFVLNAIKYYIIIFWALGKNNDHRALITISS